MVILNICAFLLMNFPAHTKVPDRYERWWVTIVTPCPRLEGCTILATIWRRAVHVGISSAYLWLAPYQYH